MRLTHAVCAGCLTTRVWLAVQPPSIVPVGGVVYTNVTWGTVTPATITIFHGAGVATVPLETLPPDLREQFGYDPQKALAYREAERRAEVARLEAWKKQQAALQAQRAREESERRKLVQREAETKIPTNTVTQLNFVTVARMVQLDQGLYRATLDDADGNRVRVQFDDSGKRFLDAAIAEQEQIQAINEQRRKQAELSRGINYSSSVVVSLAYTEVKENPELKYTRLDPKVFTVYAVQAGHSAFRLIGSQMNTLPGGGTAISW